METAAHVSPQHTFHNNKRIGIVITRRYDEILQAIHHYRFVTAQDIARLFFADTSINHVREILSRLSGKRDYAEHQYLFRFPLPDTRVGNTEKIYTLGSKGRMYLQREVGMEVDWYFRPYKVASMTYQKYRHALLLTKFLVTVEAFCKKTQQREIHTLKTDYELQKEIAKDAASVVSLPAKDGTDVEPVSVIPDAWIKLYNPTQKKRPYQPILLEVDRASEQQKFFKQQIKARCLFIKPNGGYRKLFKTHLVTIAYVTSGNETRLQSMLTWTEEVLTELNLKHYASYFRFCRLPTTEIGGFALLLAPMWARPFAKKPLSLLAS